MTARDEKPIYRIRKNVPIPTRAARSGCPFPFLDMAPGDSIVVPTKSVGSLKYWIRKFEREHRVKFVTRSESMSEIAVWRVPK